MGLGLLCFGFSAQAQVLVRMGTAGMQVADSAGATWEAPNGFSGGWQWAGNGSAIAGTADAALYRTEWVGMQGWSRAVPNGRYRVTLKMRESWWDSAGARVFNVRAEGAAQLNGVDIYAAVGKHRAYDRSFDVAVSDGVLNLEFSASANLPVVSAIEVARVDFPLPKPPVGVANMGLAIPGATLMWASDAELQASLDRTKASGVKWLRIDVAWTLMEWQGSGGVQWGRLDRVVNAARARGLNILGILTTLAPTVRPGGEEGWQIGPTTDAQRAGFAQFAAAAAARYRGRISHWEVWNEPNLDQFWAPKPSTSDYLKLLKVAYPAIKTAAPGALVMSGGTGGAAGAPDPDIESVEWYRQLYAAGAGRYWDAVAHHPYPDLYYKDRAVITETNDIRALMDANGDRNKLLWGTETGAPTGGEYSLTEAQHSAMVGHMLSAWAAIPNHGPLFWYTLQDTTDPTREGFFGLFRLNGTAKPAYATLQRHARLPGALASTLSNGAAANARFTLSTGRALPVSMLLMAVRGPSGENLDVWVGNNLTLTGEQAFTGQRARFATPGWYVYWPAYMTSDGIWHDLEPVQWLYVDG